MRQLKISKSVTNRESASLDKYLQDIGKEELISIDEEVELAQRIKKGDHVALEKMTRANLRFVVSVAKQYQNKGLSLPDLINEGNFGLIKAAEKYDETKGFKFISYAVWWIRQSILQAIAEQSRIVRLPLNQVGMLNKINKASNKLEQEFERKPDAYEVAEVLDLPADKVAETIRISGRHLSVDAPLFEGEESSLLDVLVNTNLPDTDHNLSMKKSFDKDLKKAFLSLDRKHSEVLKMVFGVLGYRSMSEDEIADFLGIPKSKVNYFKHRGLHSLRLDFSEVFSVYLG